MFFKHFIYVFLMEEILPCYAFQTQRVYETHLLPELALNQPHTGLTMVHGSSVLRTLLPPPTPSTCLSLVFHCTLSEYNYDINMLSTKCKNVNFNETQLNLKHPTRCPLTMSADVYFRPHDCLCFLHDWKPVTFNDLYCSVIVLLD